MSTAVSNSGLARSWYGAAIGDILTSEADDILGKLARHADDGQFADQRDARLAQINLLRSNLKGLDGWVFFEFNIPRMGRRVDVILLLVQSGLGARNQNGSVSRTRDETPAGRRGSGGQPVGP
jgi:hypothetical protein